MECSSLALICPAADAGPQRIYTAAHCSAGTLSLPVSMRYAKCNA